MCTHACIQMCTQVYFWNHMWLVVATATTVGYGDNTPDTHLGRAVCVICMGAGTVLCPFFPRFFSQYFAALSV